MVNYFNYLKYYCFHYFYVFGVLVQLPLLFGIATSSTVRATTRRIASNTEIINYMIYIMKPNVNYIMNHVVNYTLSGT